MQMSANWSREVTDKFPELAICIGTINGVHAQRENEEIKKLREEVYKEATAKHDAETLKDNPTVRAYRDFYWKLDIDPTKTRPSGEALLRRVLIGGQLPNISTVVDAYNLASLKTIIPISGFDIARLDPPLQIRYAKDNETFIGIGMKTQMLLTTKMLILADQQRILCVYPYRDCDLAKITMETTNVAIAAYGAPRISNERLKEAVETTLSYIKQVSGGRVATIEVFEASPK